MRKLLPLFFVCLSSLQAEAPKWTLDDVVSRETASDFQISPDSKWAVFVKSIPDKKQGKHVEHLVRCNLTSHQKTRLTRGRESCRHPRWSPKGQHLAFLSSRPTSEAKDKEAKEQIWLLDPTGGEPWRLTSYPRDIQTFAWADTRSIIFVAAEKPTLDETRAKAKKDPSRVVEDEKNAPPVRLFQVDLKTKKITRLTTNRDRIQNLALSPDGRYAVCSHSQSLRYEYDHRIRPITILHDLKSSTSKQIFKDMNIDGVKWTPDGKGFYAADQFSNDKRYLNAMVTHLHYFDLKSGKSLQVDLKWRRGLSAQIENGYRPGFLPTNHGVLALLAEGVKTPPAQYRRTKTGWGPARGLVKDSAFGFQVSRDGKTLVYSSSTASRQTQWYSKSIAGLNSGKAHQLTHLNAQLEKKTKARTEIIRWKGAKNEQVEGVVYYPHHYQKGKRYPLIVMIHGGPFGADFDAWEETWAYPANLLCQRGAFIFKPNYHGSSNYGLDWAESIARGKYYDLPIKDIETGVDALIARGLVDSKKLATMGWSNGAILSAALIASTTRYRAASAGAGGAEWVSDWGACSIGESFSGYYFGKSPLEDPQLYIKMAPLYRFDRVRTPTILFQGEADRVVPPHHAWLQFRALQYLKKADTRLVLFPKEKHSLKSFATQRRKIEEEIRWLDRHLFETKRDWNPSLKKDSPLARLLELRKAKKVGRRFGIAMKDLLVPEVVKWKGLNVGRFEVTSAQFAELDPKYEVTPGKENHPAHGITFKQAKDYCRWLSRNTGQTFRLPNAKEAELLYAKSGKGALDHWAGYSPNPEDAKRLLKEIDKLDEPLLRRVGSFVESEIVCDLGGNVAEWIEGGILRGGCAVLPASQATKTSNVPKMSRGFRVIRE